MFRYLMCAALVSLAACKDKEAAPSEVSAKSIASQLASVKIDPGQWQSTTQILSVKGPLPAEVLNQMTGQRTEASHCITPEEAARPSANFLAAQKGSNCSYQEFSMTGGKIKGRMTCTGGQVEGRVVTAMNGTYTPQAYDMVMDMETPTLPGGPAMRIRARTQGKRVGGCA